MNRHFESGVAHLAGICVGGAGVLEARCYGNRGFDEHVTGCFDIGIERQRHTCIEQYGIKTNVRLCHLLPMNLRVSQRR